MGEKNLDFKSFAFSKGVVAMHVGVTRLRKEKGVGWEMAYCFCPLF
jgi:hypothetical protein